MMFDLEMNNFNDISLGKSNINNIAKFVTVKVNYKIYEPGDIIKGEIFSEDDNRVFVISHDVICEVDNAKDNQSKNFVSVMLSNIKSTSGCAYFLAKGHMI